MAHLNYLEIKKLILLIISLESKMKCNLIECFIDFHASVSPYISTSPQLYTE